MSVVAITASRTSPGATTLAAGIAIGWSHQVEQSLLLEADPAGGVLALRFDLAPAPSLTSFGSDIRNSFSTEQLWSNTQDLRGTRCMPAPVDPMLARTWIDRVTPTLVKELPRLGAPVVIDLGWVDHDGASAKLAAAADTTLIVTRPDIAEVQALLFQVRRLQATNTNVAIVTVGDTPNDPQEIARIAGVPLAAVLPDDPKVASALAGGSFKPNKFRRSMLWRTIGGLASSLLDETLMAQRDVSTSSVNLAPPSTPIEAAFDGTRGSLEELAPASLESNPPIPTTAVAPHLQTHADVASLAIPPAAATPVPPPSAASIARALASATEMANAIAQAPPGPPLVMPGAAMPSDASVARALASATEMASIIAEAPERAPASPPPEAPSLVRSTRPTIISLAPVSAPMPTGVDPVDPGLFEDTVRMNHRLPVATLTFPSGDRRTVAPDTAITIGRHSDCDIVLNDSQVSRRHGRLIYTTDGWHYSDLGSRNGTEINGQACASSVLSACDVLTIGQTPITFETTPQREMECA